MALTGKQKAAMLLMSLDPATATEMLRGLHPDVIQELAVEMAHLDTAGREIGKSTEIARQFYDSLKTYHKPHFRNLLTEILSSASNDKTSQTQVQRQEVPHKSDPFLSIRSFDSQTIASILYNEHPQTTAVVLSKLPSPKKSEVIGLLGEGIRVSIIGRMSNCETMTDKAKKQIGESVFRQLKALNTGRKYTVSTEPRKIACTLKKLVKEFTGGLVGGP